MIYHQQQHRHLFNLHLHLHFDHGHLHRSILFCYCHHLFQTTLIFEKKFLRASHTTSFGELTIGAQGCICNNKKQKISKRQIDDTLSKLPKPIMIEVDISLLNVLLTKADGILNTDYINEKELNGKLTEDVTEENNFEKTKNHP